VCDTKVTECRSARLSNKSVLRAPGRWRGGRPRLRATPRSPIPRSTIDTRWLPSPTRPSPDSLEFPIVPHQVVIALFLPKGIAGQSQHRVGPFGRDAFQRLGQFGQCRGCSGRQMNVIGMTTKAVERPTAGFVQQSIHGGKCLPGIECSGGKSSVGRQAVVETPSGLIDVRSRVIPD